jgi:uncharacterized membrane protein
MEALIVLALLLYVIGLPVVAIAALSRVGRLERKVTDLERRLQATGISTAAPPPAEAPAARAAEAAPPAPEPAPDTAAAAPQSPSRPATEAAGTGTDGPAEPAPVRPAPTPAEPPLTLEPEDLPPVAPPAGAQPAAGPSERLPRDSGPPMAPDQTPEWVVRAKEWLFGGNLVARLGVLVLFFGVAFLLKYAAEQGLFPIELRLAAAAAGGIALVALGWRLRLGNRAYALVLQGGGIGIVYLTVFAAIDTWPLVPAGPGLALMVALVGLAAALAVLQDARSLALLAVVGGFLAPVLISREGSHVALFSYYLALNLGILGIAWFKAWRELNLAGFLFTFAIGALWGWRAYQPEHFATTEPFLVAFFLLYLAVPVLFALRQPPNLKGLVDGTLVFGVPLIAFGLQAALVRDFEYGAALSATAAALIYASLATLVWRRQGEPLRTLAEAFLGLAVAFGTLAIPLAVDGRWTASAWALEGAALVWLGLRQGRLLPRAAGLLIQGAAGIALIGAARDATGDVPVINGAYLSALLVALAALFSAWQLHRHRDRTGPAEARLGPLVLAWSLLWWFGAGNREIQRWLSHDQEMDALLLFGAGTALALAWLRRRLAWPALAWPPLLLLALLAVALLHAADIGPAHPFAGWGWVAWTAAFTVQYLLLRRLAPDWPPGLTALWHAATLWLALLVLAWEAFWIADGPLDLPQAWRSLAWVLVPIAALAAYPALRRRLPWPLQALDGTYRGLALTPVLVAVGLWVLWASFQRGNPVLLPYLPLLNPLELGQAIGLAVMVHWGLRTDAPWPPWRWYALTALAFAVLNGLIARSVHFFGDVPFAAGDLWASARFQAAIAIAWTLLAMAAMAAGTRLRLRAAWIAGAALLVLVVGKLFLVDLSGVGTVARIVSFLAVGALILLIGYVAPLPPQNQEEKRA